MTMPMKRYRYKPKIIEARQWHTGEPPCEGMQAFPPSNSVQNTEGIASNYCVRQGPRTVFCVYDGDWIIKENGKFCVVDPETFELCEPVE